MSAALRIVSSILLAAMVAGCDRPAPTEDGTLVAATVAPLADLVRTVAGDQATVVNLVPDGVDSHTFEPTPRDAQRLSRAALFIANGLGLEEPSLRLAEANLPEGAAIVQLGDLTVPPDEWVFDRAFPRAGGLPNPHLWLDVRHAIAYVGHIADALTDVVPLAAADRIRDSAAELTVRLERLDEAIATATATIPPPNRKLITYHDSWAYFGPRYGLQVIAAVQPEGFTEPSADEVRRVIDQIRAEGVTAVFGSEVFPSEVLRTIAAETGVTFVGDLADDALPGRPGDPEHSYVGMMVRNVRIVVDALGGDPAALDAVDPAPRP